MSRHRARRAPQRLTVLLGRETVRRGVRVAARALVVAVAVALVAVTGIGWWWSGSASSSDALHEAGSVGVIEPPASSAPGSTPGIGTTTNPPATPASHGATPTTSETRDPDPFGDGENILVVGVDSRTDAEGNPLTAKQQRQIGVPLDGGGVNTDTLLILHIPGDGTRITGISIPRDTWMGRDVVRAPGIVGPDSSGGEVLYRPGKINGFYGTAKYYRAQYLKSQGVTGAELVRESDEAGRTMLIKIVQQFTGIKIDHYAEANLLGFYLMSQAIGGVPVCLLHSVHDRASGAHFPAGEFTVEGKKALAFVRQRHHLPGGDLARIKRQQAFLQSAANKMLSIGTLANPSRLTSLVDAVKRSLVLDSDLDLLTFADQLNGMVTGNLHFATLPTQEASDITTTDALRADPAQVRRIFAALTGGRPLPKGVASHASKSVHVTASTSKGSVAPGTTTSPSRASSSSTSSTSSTGESGYQVPCVN